MRAGKANSEGREKVLLKMLFTFYAECAILKKKLARSGAWRIFNKTKEYLYA